MITVVKNNLLVKAIVDDSFLFNVKKNRTNKILEPVKTQEGQAFIMKCIPQLLNKLTDVIEDKNHNQVDSQAQTSNSASQNNSVITIITSFNAS